MHMADNLQHLKGPLVIGGIGGSGTRVLARILQLFNIFMGDDLNSPLDNLSYTLLFKRPRWFYKNFNDERKLITGLRILEKTMLTRKPFSLSEMAFLGNAVAMMARFGHNKQLDGKGQWAFQRLHHILFPKKRIAPYHQGWGWKEPNSHLILSSLNPYFPNLKYIHSIRHGLDMAYSANQQQLFNWGPMFGINLPENPEEIPVASYRYWVKVNQKVIQQGEAMEPNRFLAINFDNFCANPQAGLTTLIDFLELAPSQKSIEEALKVPVAHASMGRFRKADNSLFQNEDLGFLHSLGFSSV